MNSNPRLVSFCVTTLFFRYKYKLTFFEKRTVVLFYYHVFAPPQAESDQPIPRKSAERKLRKECFHGICNPLPPTTVGPGCEVEKRSKLSELDIPTYPPSDTFKEGAVITIDKVVFNSPFH